jgi:hypothetical protein
MFSLVTTRFDNYTWSENINFREQNNLPGCIYGSPQPMSPKIIQDSLVFVVEMNNQMNQIEGIGVIKNTIRLDKYFRVYETGNFNRYVFRGKYRISREELLKIDDKLVTILDYILFKEKTHLKRGSGFTQIPEKLLKHTKCENMDIKNTIKHIFLRLFDINIDNNKKKEIEKTEKKEEIMEKKEKTEKKELKKRQLIIEE